MRTKRIRLLGLIAGVILLASCGSPNPGQPQTTIQGTLVDPCGQPVPYKTVSVGGKIAVTDTDGHFSFTGVTVPYDLAVVNATLMRQGLEPERVAGPSVLIFQHLSQENPTITLLPLEGSRCIRKTLSGTLSPDQDSGAFGIAILSGTIVSNDIEDYVSGGSDTFSFDYLVPSSQAGKKLPILAAGWSLDEDGNADTYYGALKTELNVPVTDASTQDLTLDTDVTTQRLEVTVTGNAIVRPKGVYHHLALDGVDTGIETAYVDLNGGAGPATLKTLEYPGVSSLLVATGTYGGTLGVKSVSPEDLSSIRGLAWTWKQVDPGTGTAMAELPEPVVPISPPSGARIEKNTVFKLTGPEGTIYDSALSLYGPEADVMIEVITSANDLRLPDLSPLGISYGGLFGLEWRILGVKLPGITTVDDLLPKLPALLGNSPDGAFAFLGEQGSGFYVKAGEYTFPDATW